MRRVVTPEGVTWTDDGGEPLLVMGEALSGREATLRLEGSISTAVAPAFEDELTAAATVCDRIVVDCAGVEVISGGGLKALLLVQRLLDRRQGTMLKLRAMRPSVYHTFVDMGFHELFEIENEGEGGC